MTLLEITDEKNLILKLVTGEDDDYEYEAMSGGDSTNPTWDEYMDNITDKYKPHWLLIRQAIEKMGWVGDTGAMRSNDTLFVFSDGTNLGFTFRAWGDLMQAIVNKKEGYMKYYM